MRRAPSLSVRYQSISPYLRRRSAQTRETDRGDLDTGANASAEEAEEAEELAKELGVWDEFYGSGKAGARKSKGGRKGKGKATREDEEAGEEDVSALQALILKKRKNMDSFFDGLAEKYAEPAPKGKKGKKRSKAAVDEEDEEVSWPSYFIVSSNVSLTIP